MIIEVFLPLVVGALKPSITFRSLGSLQLAPAHSQLTPQFAPAHSPVHSSLLPSSLQLTPAHSPVCSSSLLPCPIAPYTPQVVGTPTHTWPLGASWSKLERAGSELEVSWSKLGVSWSELEQGEQAGASWE